MTQLIAKASISAPSPIPDSATARDGFAGLWDFISELLSTAEIDITCAATLNVGGQLSGRLRLTGSAVTITSFGTSYRGPIFIRCSAAYNFTHNATSLLCPGGVSLAAPSGTVLMATPKCSVSGTHDGWQIVVLARGDGGLKLSGPLVSSTGVTIRDFDTGTRMPFNQTAAPTGWVKDTTAALDNTAMRIVTGTVGSGGSVPFTTAFASTVTGGHSLIKSEIPPHVHSFQSLSYNGTPTSGTWYINSIGDQLFRNTGDGAADGLQGLPHTHTLALAVKYNDFILATKQA